VFDTVIPTKMLEFMSCGRPVILAANGQAREILEGSRGGLGIGPENATALCEAIEKLRSQQYLRDSLGQNGREYIVQNLARERTASHYLNVLQGILAGQAHVQKAAA
jgi:glycosyltransferase involved in cell wall biosynthesis